MQIRYAFRHSNIMKHSMFITKVTARFYIPDLHGFLSRHDMNNYDVFTQNYDERCEMIGAHINKFNELFYPNLIDGRGMYNGHVEKVYSDRIKHFHRVLRAPLFQIEPTQRGGLNEMYNTL